MTIDFHDLDYAQHLRFPSLGNGLHLVRAKGRATLLEIPCGWSSIWMPVTGGLTVKSPDTAWSLASRDLLIWHEGDLRNSGQQPAWFLVLTGPASAWQSHLAAPGERTGVSSNLFPTHGHCTRETRRLFVRLARLGSRQDRDLRMIEQLTAAFLRTVMESQDEMHRYLERCNGRTAKRRHHTLLRLLRVRHLVGNNPNNRFDLHQLSRIANYSPWHLTRTYRDVFGETPAEHAVRVRLKRAMELVRGSTLTVREITEELGFESQSTFCRSFKRAYGLTTRQARIVKQ